MLRALILGTVAHDAFHRRLKTYPPPLAAHEPNAQGIYVIGLRRQSAQGEFLDGNELAKLINGLQRYIQGAEVLAARPNPASRTSSDNRLVQWTAEVDASHAQINAPASPSQTRFIKSPGDAMTFRELVKSLQKRLPQASSTARQIQSPLYVGCSQNLARRMADYDVSRRFATVNKPLAITVCVLKALGLPVLLELHVALRTWKVSQLPVAEQLVMSLAGCLVYQTGFNVVPGGAHKGSAAGLYTAGEMLFSGYPGFLQANLQASLQDRDSRCRFEERLHAVDQRLAVASRIKTELVNASPRLQQFAQTHARDTIALARQRRDRAREALKQAQQAHATATTLTRVLQEILPDECARLGGGHLVKEEDDL